MLNAPPAAGKAEKREKPASTAMVRGRIML
jgi:hypothetical protein